MMEYLTPQYWEKINNEKNNKGMRFEKLVLDLLIAEYGKAAFQNTKHSWDGSKDFYYYSEKRNFWAECKNYASSIDLKVLASTLIMAQISKIDTVLFYSYSPININTKAKLLISAEKKGKTIYFYDGIVLERKIFQFWDYIGEHYFPSFSYKERCAKQLGKSYEAKCLLYGNPLNMGSSIDGYELNHLTLFKMFEMDICIINKENCNNLISLQFKNIEQIKAQFEIYPEHIVKSNVKISLAPYEGKTIRVWLIPIKENCIIPQPYINGKKLSLPKNIEFKALEIRNNRRLIGKSYEQCVEDFKQEVLFETNKLKMGILYGSSGTGKSKLYNECLNIAKINGYEIIDFCSVINSGKEQPIREFIQKLLVEIYDISLNEMEQIFKTVTFNNGSNKLISSQPEYSMLAEIFNISNDIEMQNWLDKYLNLIIYKLSERKFIIAVDNTQFLNESIIDLIDQIYNQLIRINSCNTKFVLTFNIDYVKRNSKADIFLGNHTSNCTVSFVKKTKGFEDSNECFEFLQEVLSIGDIFEENEICNIAENMSNNPFFLEQMVDWLRDKNALEISNNQYIVRNELLLKSLIKNVPNNVYNILEARWNFYKNNNESRIEITLILFSAIYLYKELEKKDIDILDISWDLIKELERLGYILLEDTSYTITIKFQHDLIDNFFSKMYSYFSKRIIDYENKKNIIIKDNNIRYYFGMLYSVESDSFLSNIKLSEIMQIHIDGRLAYEFYTLVFEKYLDSFDYLYKDNEAIWINNINLIIITIHDILGNTIMKICVDKLFSKLRNLSEIFQYIEYGRLIIYISEAYDSMGNYQEAVKLVKDYKDKAFGLQDEYVYTKEQEQFLSEIYNRLHVYYRHQILTPLENRDIMAYLDKSAAIADKLEYTVMQYVNYSDRGYLYYDLPLSDEEHVNTLFYWEKACEIYEKGNAESKELNYLRKKVQIALLKGESEKAVHTIEAGLEKIKFSIHAYQQTFFKWWFYHALAEGYLLSYTDKNNVLIEKALERARFYSELLDSNKKFYYLQLKAIYMFYKGKTDIAIKLNTQAKEMVQDSNYKMKKGSLLHQLIQNEKTMISYADKPQIELYSQIHTVDCLFNLPCI